MSILDTFFILFKTDAAEAAKDVEKVGDAGEKAADGLKEADAASTGLGNSMLELARRIGVPALSLAGLVAALGTGLTVAMQRASSIRELDQFSSKLNSSISSVDAFQRIVTGMGGETSAALDSLVKIGEKINEAFSDAKSGARKDFQEWGLAFKDAKGQALGASEGMLALAGNLEKVSRAEALARIKKLGIEDPATIDLLLRGRRALEDQIRTQKEMGVVTEEQARIVREYYGELGGAKNALESVGNAIFTFFAPAMTSAARAFRQFVTWIAENKTLVTGFFVGLGVALAGVSLVLWGSYIPAMTAAAVATLVALSPFIAIAAAVLAVGAAFALIYEDVSAFLNGQPSLIGTLAKRYEWFGDLINGLGKTYQALKAGGQAALKGLSEAWGWLKGAFTTYVDTVLAFWGKLKPIFDAYRNYLRSLGELGSAIGGRIRQALGPLMTYLGERAEAIGDAIRKVLDGIGEMAQKAGDALEKYLGGAFREVKNIWDSTIGWIAGQIQGLADRIRTLASEIRGAPEAAPPTVNTSMIGGQPTAADRGMTEAGAIAGAVFAGQRALANASAAPINGQTSQSLPGNSKVSVDNSSEVNVGSVVVNTQATDAAGMARAARNELQKQLRGTASRFDDGLDR